MTEHEWRECDDPEPLFRHLYLPASTLLNVRKERLLGCAFCRSLWPQFTGFCEVGRAAIGVMERLADGDVSADELDDVHMRFDVARKLSNRHHGARDPLEPLRFLFPGVFGRRPEIIRFVAKSVRRAIPKKYRHAEFARQAGIIRDVVGNPFRPVLLDPRWRTANVVDLVRTIDEDGAYERLPILADALMDAGCDDEQIIGHCRTDGPHVRGCWVVDHLLGKS